MTWPGSVPTRSGRIARGTRVGCRVCVRFCSNSETRLKSVGVTQVQPGLTPPVRAAPAAGSPPARPASASRRAGAARHLRQSAFPRHVSPRSRARRSFCVSRAGSKSARVRLGRNVMSVYVTVTARSRRLSPPVHLPVVFPLQHKPGRRINPQPAGQRVIAPAQDGQQENLAACPGLLLRRDGDEVIGLEQGISGSRIGDGIGVGGEEAVVNHALAGVVLPLLPPIGRGTSGPAGVRGRGSPGGAGPGRGGRRSRR